MTQDGLRKYLRKAARLWGVQPDYIDASGNLVHADSASLRKILELLSSQKINSRSLQLLLQQPREQKVRRMLEPVYVQKRPGIISVTVFFPELLNIKEFTCRIRLEDGRVLPVTPMVTLTAKHYPISKGSYRRAILRIYEYLPTGYHHLEFLKEDQLQARTLLLCPPEPPKKSAEKKWGLFSPLYALQSSTSWGIGDLRDLGNLQEKISEWGGDSLGTLPLLATCYEGPFADVSPYSPVSKLFWNEIFLNIPDLLQEAGYSARDIEDELSEEISRLNATPLVDYENVFRLKKRILKKLSADFFSSLDEKSEYREFLQRFPLVVEYAAFRSQGNEEERRYHLYSQFQMNRKLAQLKSASLYLDFPVGANPHGFDCSYFSSLFLKDFTVGAPPDPVFKKGQNWGFWPLNSCALRDQEYAYFIRCLCHHMQYARVLRLDHIMSLKRLYIIPPGETADKGVYLRYNIDEFFAVLAIEAARHGVEVIGENLGTVPDAVQHSIAENNFLGMWLLPFEANEHPLTAIKKIPPANLACLNTHDMDPFQGFLNKNERLLKAWQKDFFEKDREALFAKMSILMAKSPAKMLLINVEDMWQEEKPQNIPGTWKEYPNWRKKLKYPLDQWTENSDVTDFLKHLTLIRKARKEHEYPVDAGRSVSL